MTVTKGDIVDLALRKAVIASSSVGFMPEPAATKEALEDLEALAAAWMRDGLDIGYLVDPDGNPNPGDDSGIDLSYKMAVALQLARHILIDNSRDATPDLLKQINSAWDLLRTTFYKSIPLKRRNDMPTGAGNNQSWAPGRFYDDGTAQ